jgi:hypothetical protein
MAWIVRLTYSVEVISSMLTDSKKPPAMLIRSAKMQRKGIIRIKGVQGKPVGKTVWIGHAAKASP